jgi:hypothetical protein
MTKIMLDILKNLTKATVVALVLTPLAIVADILMLPISAYNYDDPFKVTEECLKILADYVKWALE